MFYFIDDFGERLYDISKETVLPYISELISSGKLEMFDMDLLDNLRVPTEMMPEDVFECLFLIQYSMLYNNINETGFAGYEDVLSEVDNGHINWEKTRAMNTLAYGRIVVRAERRGWETLAHKFEVLSLQLNLKLIKDEERRQKFEKLIDRLHKLKKIEPICFEELSYDEMWNMGREAYSNRRSMEEYAYDDALIKFAYCIIDMTHSM